MSTHEHPAIPALPMFASFDAQELADEENLKLAKYMVTYKESVCFAVPTSTTLAFSSIYEELLQDQQLAIWNPHEHFWQHPIFHKLLTCTCLDD